MRCPARPRNEIGPCWQASTPLGHCHGLRAPRRRVAGAQGGAGGQVMSWGTVVRAASTARSAARRAPAARNGRACWCHIWAMGDDELIAATARGDADAFASLYRRHLARVVGYLLHDTGGPEVAADLAAEVFAAALASCGRYRPEHASAAPWLIGTPRTSCARAADGDASRTRPAGGCRWWRSRSRTATSSGWSSWRRSARST